VEWVGLLALVSLLFLALLAAGVRVPGTALVRALADRMVCAVATVDGCGDEPGLVAAYGSEVGELVRGHMPTLVSLGVIIAILAVAVIASIWRTRGQRAGTENL